MSPVEHKELAFGERRRRGRAVAAVKQGDLAEYLPRRQVGENHLSPFDQRKGDAHSSREDAHHRVTGRTRREDRITGIVAAPVGPGGQITAALLIKGTEKNTAVEKGSRRRDYSGVARSRRANWHRAAAHVIVRRFPPAGLDRSRATHPAPPQGLV